ncbi:MAG: hypothetical protein IKO40_13610, partial [Kiritimatiellae bacterium]|nr:hypothetical protein [Kiritimatiellia bacterium]
MNNMAALITKTMCPEWKGRLRLFCFIWVAVSVWQFCLALVMLRSFAVNLFPIGFLSYAFSAGYLIDIVTGCR